MTDDELLETIKDNFDNLQGEMTAGEFFFGIGMDGSSFAAEIEVTRTLRSNSFQQQLREAGIEFLMYRNGKIEFVEVQHGY
jgi:hypothetical protein